ncbi:MAG: hypothetical protein M0C28_21515 [Candidatus Moduliflexus flocculans]|nr:hypothetical protein [Candidatus Moduliflexus flocculans]
MAASTVTESRAGLSSDSLRTDIIPVKTDTVDKPVIVEKKDGAALHVHVFHQPPQGYAEHDFQLWIADIEELSMLSAENESSRLMI